MKCICGDVSEDILRCFMSLVVLLLNNNKNNNKNNNNINERHLSPLGSSSSAEAPKAKIRRLHTRG